MRGANDDRVPAIYLFYSGPRNGWVLVPWTTVHRLGLHPRMFSVFSRADESGIYVEELVDFPWFEKIFRTKTNERIVFFDITDEWEDIKKKAPARTYPLPKRMWVVDAGKVSGID